MQAVEKRILIKAANLYYTDGLKQGEIAARLGVDRTTVSKYLKRALATGIVRITVETDSNEELESALERRFGLREAYVVAHSIDLEQVKRRMAQAGLSLLRRIVTDGQTIGLAWGTSIRELTRYAAAERLHPVDADFVPLDGGPESVDSELHVNTLCYELANAFGGRSHYIYAPAIARTAEIAAAIRQDVNFEQITNFWEQLDIGIVGIGAPVKSSNLVWMGSFGRESIESLLRERVVGEICSMFYDIQGKPVTTEFHDRIIAVELERLRALDYSIGMAASREKVPAILGALRGHFINVLITDEETAKILLNE